MEEDAKTTRPLFGILMALSLAHGLNDMMQSVITAVYPLLKTNLALSFAEIGAVTFTYQISASIFQPICGYLFDKKPNSWFLPVGLGFTMLGLLMIAVSGSLAMLMVAVFFAGIGSSVLHPEASRLTSMASNAHRGLAQSIFQVGGSTGWAFGPLLAAFVVSPYGQQNVAVFSVCAFVAIIGLIPVCKWYAGILKARKEKVDAEDRRKAEGKKPLPKKMLVGILMLLIFLVFTKNAYTISISNYYTFYLIEKFGVSIQTSQIMLFAFLFSAAMGTLLGGPIGDKIGRRLVIMWSIFGAAPFALIMPYANLQWTLVLSVIIGFVMSSAFSAILVYAQELFPTRVGMVSGMFFGLAFGFAGMMSAAFGHIADVWGIDTVYVWVSFVPLLGSVAYFLPRVRTLQAITKVPDKKSPK